MVRLPRRRNEQISRHKVHDLPVERLEEARKLVSWAVDNFEPRTRNIRRSKPLTRWDENGAEEAFDALLEIEDLLSRRDSLAKTERSRRESCNSLMQLTKPAPLSELDVEVGDALQHIEARKSTAEQLASQLRAEREFLEERLGPLRQRHEDLHGVMDELASREKDLKRAVQETGAALEECVAEVAFLDNGLTELMGVIDGLR